MSRNQFRKPGCMFVLIEKQSFTSSSIRKYLKSKKRVFVAECGKSGNKLFRFCLLHSGTKTRINKRIETIPDDTLTYPQTAEFVL